MRAEQAALARPAGQTRARSPRPDQPQPAAHAARVPRSRDDARPRDPQHRPIAAPTKPVRPARLITVEPTREAHQHGRACIDSVTWQPAGCPLAARPSRTDLVTGEPGGLMLVPTLATGPAAGRAAAHGHEWRAAGASVRPRGPGPVRTRPFPRLRQWRRADRDGCRRPAEPACPGGMGCPALRPVHRRGRAGTHWSC
jgi:hypothetical protein